MTQPSDLLSSYPEPTRLWVSRAPQPGAPVLHAASCFQALPGPSAPPGLSFFSPSAWTSLATGPPSLAVLVFPSARSGSGLRSGVALST